MSLDANVSSALGLIEAFISKVKWRVKAPEDAPEQFKKHAEQLDYNLLDMKRPWEEYIGEASSILTYGFHTPEIIMEAKDTPVGSFKGWKDLRTISQDTVHKWIRRDGDLKGIQQKVANTVSANITQLKDPQIPRRKFIHFRNNPKVDNPEGTSSLRGCYLTWKYLSLIEEFETIYATKGLGGVLELGIDATYLAKAAADPTSSEASVLNDIIQGAANFHNGDQSFVITPLHYDVSGKPLFHTKILETKPPDTDKIVKRHSHRILQIFFADVLQLGSNGSGSFALSEDKSSLLHLGITHHLNTILRALNHDLIRVTYEVNGWDWDARYAARFVYDDFEDDDITAFAGAVQKLLAVNAVDRTTDIEDVCRDKIFDLAPRAEANTEVREVSEGQSRSGDGLKSGLPNGTGDSTSSGGDRSTANVSQETQ